MLVFLLLSERELYLDRIYSLKRGAKCVLDELHGLKESPSVASVILIFSLSQRSISVFIDID